MSSDLFLKAKVEIDMMEHWEVEHLESDRQGLERWFSNLFESANIFIFQLSHLWLCR